LRYKSNQDVINLIKKSKQKRFLDTVERVVVSEYDKETNEVWLQIWCIKIISLFFVRWIFPLLLGVVLFFF
jgi:hypothetical protein